mmetsp:Transcript_26833/g.57762  ORF Transcript_26833/g.57762 Transcript_26833/m.57762 type:complete len:214 (+) Transcript_26833:1-642(+)
MTLHFDIQHRHMHFHLSPPLSLSDTYTHRPTSQSLSSPFIYSSRVKCMRNSLHAIIPKIQRQLQLIQPSQNRLNVKMSKLDILPRHAVKLLRHGGKRRIRTAQHLQRNLHHVRILPAHVLFPPVIGRVGREQPPKVSGFVHEYRFGSVEYPIGNPYGEIVGGREEARGEYVLLDYGGAEAAESHVELGCLGYFVAQIIITPTDVFHGGCLYGD